jgi:tetrapyrrole methylase family protein/MazG family protein
MITILGLGPGGAHLLTREAWDVLCASRRVYLRTRRHPTVAELPPHLELRDFDDLYEHAARFEDVYAEIAARVIAAAQASPEGVVYAVPGHPLVGEASVHLIMQRAGALGIPVRLVAGLSFIEPTLERVAASEAPACDPLDGLQICDALALAALHHPPLSPDQPALIAQVYSRAVASDLKLTLMNQYPPSHQVFVVRGGAPLRATTLATLDHSDDFDHLTTLYLPALPRAGSFESLQETVAHLRAPEGCPWDREQTHESLRSTLLEETYEVLAAIDAGDLAALREELGDLLLNVVMQAQIATESETFRMSDVIADLIAKLRRRHPHVFGAAVADTAEQVVANWNAIKRQEKGQQARSALDGIPEALPALAQAQKMARRAEQAGFDWDSHDARLVKVREELEEVVNARDPDHRMEEFGDLIFTIADWADGYDIDIETAARMANQKFARRFRALERLAHARGLSLSTLSAEEKRALWRQIKEADVAD